jgi:hexosaminidase
MKALRDLILLPRPRSISPGPGGALDLPADGTITVEAGSLDASEAGRELTKTLENGRGIRWRVRPGARGSETRAIVRCSDRSLPAQGYRLQLTPTHLEIASSDRVGAHYAMATLAQILRQVAGPLPLGTIEDWPDLASRGVMLDISLDKVPTLDTLFSLVDKLAGWKVNQLQLYMEHTFAYRDHEEVWAQASPMTGEDIERLDAYCRDRFIELVPNQNSFGHFERWLKLPRYRHLAEGRDGWVDPPFWWTPPYPLALCPGDPGSIALLEDLYDELLPRFSSTWFNVGCDEVDELAFGRSGDECRRIGQGRVYFDFLQKIHALVRDRGHTMLFWGDMVGQHYPELLPEIPEDCVVLEWGYEEDYPFDARLTALTDASVRFIVCPATSLGSTWFWGRTTSVLANIRNAARAGIEHGAEGLLNTDWGDDGHWQYLPTSYVGFAAGAAFSWSLSSNGDDDVLAALDPHVFEDRAEILGGVARDLGLVIMHADAKLGWDDAVFSLISEPDDRALPEGLDLATIARTEERIEAILAPLGSARPSGADGSIVVAEFENVGRMLRHACHRGRALLEGSAATSTTAAALASEMRSILGNHRELWIARDHVGGLHDSTKAMVERLDGYRTASSRKESP